MKSIFSLIFGTIFSTTIFAQTVTVLEPLSGIVGQYEKIEFAVGVPIAIQASINNYFGSGGYGNNYNNTYINPYDPDEISIEATFKYMDNLAEPTIPGWGFYYREFSYSSTPITPSTDWVENTSLNTHWRLRFAPKLLGTWKVTYVVRHNGTIVFTDNVGVTFTCVSSSNKGFVKFGPNGKFLQHTNGEAIFPAGVCVGWPDPEKYDGNNNAYLPIEYTEHRQRIQVVADGGGNFTKVIFTPYSYGFEWEHLNNYDNRQMLMWEFDNLIDQAENNNMLIHVGTETGEGYEPNPSYIYSWNNNPYKDLANVNDLEDFFGEPNAINTYKKRIRYMIARWGYSSQISSWELMNEVEKFYTRLGEDASADNLLTDWHDEVAQYIKNTLQHKNHLVSASYGMYLLGIGNLNAIDFLNQHSYYSKDRKCAEYIYNDIAYFDPYNKPTFITEFGAAHYGDCELSPNDNFYIDYAYPTHHNSLWSSSFTGSPCAGVEWWETGLDYGLYMDDIVVLRDFFAPHNLDAGNYKRQRFLHANDNMESYMLVNNNGVNASEVLGWVHNKSYYWFNFTQSSSCSYYDADLASDHATSGCPNYDPNDDDAYSCPLEGNLGAITITGLKTNTNFGIEWYNTTTGEVILVTSSTTNASGILTLNTPNFTNGAHDYAFKIRQFYAMCSPDDFIEIAQIDAAGKSEIMLNNRCNQLNGAIRTDNLVTSAGTWVSHGIDEFDGWMDENDKFFIGDINNDGIDEGVLVNTTYSFGAIRVINISTGANISLFNHGTYSTWMDATDKMFLGDVNNDGNDDLVFVNTSYSGGAIRAVDLNTGATINQINHGSFGGWMDATDKMFLGDINNDGKEDLVLVNTNYASGSAVRVIDITTGGSLIWLPHGSYAGWMEATDLMFLGDVNNDNKEDLVFVNTNYSGGAIRAIDVLTGNNLSWINHGTFSGWMDASDKIVLQDVSGDNKADLILVNTGGGANFRVLDIMTNTSLAWVTNAMLNDFRACADKILIGDVIGNGNKDLLFVNSANTNNAFVVYDMNTSSFTAKHHNSYNPSLLGWKDGSNQYNLCLSFRNMETEEEVVEQNSELIIYPNPATSQVYISGMLSGMTVECYNINGSLLKSELSNGSDFVMDVSSLPNGIYLLRIISGTKFENKRLIISR